MKTTSKLFKVDYKDLTSVFLVALCGFVLDFATNTILPNLDIDPNIKTMLAFGISYLGKKFFTPAEERRKI